MTDKKFEELLKEAVEQCAEKEWEEISQKSKKIRYKQSKEFEEKRVVKIILSEMSRQKVKKGIFVWEKEKRELF